VTEEHPLDLSRTAPERVRDRIEADLTVCQRMGLSPVSIAVLRFAEILGPECGSQLHDYLKSKVALRPMGFDPMLNVLTVDDAVRALLLAVLSTANGIFNIVGADTLPLSETIRKSGRIGVALPGVLLAPAYQLRAGYLGMEFRYDLNFRRFHFSAVLDGTRACQVLGYEPRVPVDWPVGGPIGLARPSRGSPGTRFEAPADHAGFAPII
jgi:UDP-glucose 4-epimerase